MFRKTVTENYPYEPVHFNRRLRGIHVLHRDEAALKNALLLPLRRRLPANCIYIEAAENTVRRDLRGRALRSVYNIDYSRCIFCGYCVEACPTDAITHGHASSSRPTTSTRWFTGRTLLEKNPPLRLRLHVNLLRASLI